jgi:predicted nucleic acid-binding protein
MTVTELSERHRRIAVDSNVLVYLLEAVEPWALQARELLNAIEGGGTAGVMSVIGLAEVCAGPARRGELALVERYTDALGSLPGLRIEPLTVRVAVDAAVIRAARGIGLADAMHLASARAAGATAFVTSDHRIRGSARLEVIYLDELAIA